MNQVGGVLLACLGVFLPALLAWAIWYVVNKGSLHTEDGAVDRHADPITFWLIVAIMVAFLVGLLGFEGYVLLHWGLEVL